MRLSTILCIGLLTIPNLANAAAKQKKFGEFFASVELGYITTSGNRSSTSFIAKADGGNETLGFRNQFAFDSIFKQDEVTLTLDDGEKITDKITSKEKYFASAQTNYKLNDTGDAVFGYLSFEADRFGVFDYQSSVVIGYNTRILDSETGFWDISVGPGYSFDSFDVRTDSQGYKLDDDGNRVVDSIGELVLAKPDEKQARTAPIGRAATTYQRKISETIKFKAAYSMEKGELSEKSVFETSISMQVNGSLAVKASVLNKLNRNSFKTSDDKRNTITLVYNF